MLSSLYDHTVQFREQYAINIAVLCFSKFNKNNTCERDGDLLILVLQTEKNDNIFQKCLYLLQIYVYVHHKNLKAQKKENNFFSPQILYINIFLLSYFTDFNGIKYI